MRSDLRFKRTDKRQILGPVEVIQRLGPGVGDGSEEQVSVLEELRKNGSLGLRCG